MPHGCQPLLRSRQCRRVASPLITQTASRVSFPRPYEVLGALAAAHPHALEVEQRLAWEQEIETLAAALLGITGSIYLEFDVPRLGSRIDAV